MGEEYSLWKFVNVDCINYIRINNYSRHHAKRIMLGFKKIQGLIND